MSQRISAPLGFGLITIFTVLLVLTLTVFSALTLSSAKADMALSERAAAYTTAYYAADTAAVVSVADFLGGSDTELEAAFPISTAQSLAIQVVKTGTDFKILLWQVRYTGETPTDSTLPVWQG